MVSNLIISIDFHHGNQLLITHFNFDQFKLPTKTLVFAKVYIILQTSKADLSSLYFRPLFLYGCVVWDNAPTHEYLFNEMEKIQIPAARITGTNKYAHKN